MQAFFYKAAATLLTFANLAIKVESFLLIADYISSAFSTKAQHSLQVQPQRAGPFFRYWTTSIQNFIQSRIGNPHFLRQLSLRNSTIFYLILQNISRMRRKTGVISFARISFIVFYRCS